MCGDDESEGRWHRDVSKSPFKQNVACCSADRFDGNQQRRFDLVVVRAR